MTSILTATFREDDPAELARRLRLMAAAINPDCTMTVTLTPLAARRTARAIEAGVLAMDVAKRMAPPPADQPDDPVPRSNVVGLLGVAAILIFCAAILFAGKI